MLPNTNHEHTYILMRFGKGHFAFWLDCVVLGCGWQGQCQVVSNSGHTWNLIRLHDLVKGLFSSAVAHTESNCGFTAQRVNGWGCFWWKPQLEPPRRSRDHYLHTPVKGSLSPHACNCCDILATTAHEGKGGMSAPQGRHREQAVSTKTS